MTMMYLQRSTKELVAAIGVSAYAATLTLPLYRELLKTSELRPFWRLPVNRHPWSLVLACAGVAAVFAIANWGHLVREQFTPKRWRSVVPGHLYASGQISARLIERTLCQNGIDVVVDLTGLDMTSNDQLRELSTCERLGIEHYRLPLEGNGTGDVNCYAKAIEHIVRAAAREKRVLVHCAAGTQRTGGVLAVYRLLVLNDSPEVILRSLEESGFDEARNPDLLPFLDEHMDVLARRLVQRGVLPQMPASIPSLQAAHRN